MMHLIFSRSSSSIHGACGTVECMRLYWFCHKMSTEASRNAARSALLKGIFPFLVVETPLGLFFSIERCIKYPFSTSMQDT